MNRIDIHGDYVALQRYFMERLLNITQSKSMVGLVWEEVYNAHTVMPKDTIIHVWYTSQYLLNTVIDTQNYRNTACYVIILFPFRLQQMVIEHYTPHVGT